MPIDPSIPLSVQPVDVAGDVARRQAGRLQPQLMQQQIEMNALKLQEAKKQASLDPQAEQRLMQEVLAETGGDLALVPGALAKRGYFKEAMEVLKGWDEHVKATKGTPAQPKVVQVQTVDDEGNPVTKFVEEQAGQSFPMVPKAQTETLPASAKEYEYAKAQGYKGTFEEYQNADANRKRPVVNVGSGAEPLVPIIGPDGRPVLVRRSQAEGKQPASSREQGRAVTSGDANRMADYDSSLNDLKVLKQTVGTVAGSTGTAARVGASLPNFVTEATGLGATAKQKQAVIDRVKQVIGKALEGGVLRKEDEYKYTKILPTIGDVPSVVAAKLNGLEAAIAQRRQTQLDNLADAGYDTSRFEARTAAPTGEATSGAIKVGPYTVREKK